MLEMSFLESVIERDIDLLLLEELSVSENFRKMFTTLIFGERAYNVYIRVWHSIIISNLGESDLIFRFEDINGLNVAILIENKIDSTPMPDQGLRYHLRGEEGIKKGEWNAFKTCIIAPKKYLVSVKDTECYDSHISYEEIHSYFTSEGINDDRLAYKARIISQAIQKNRRGYQPTDNELVTAFVKDYCKYANENYPALKIQKPKPRQDRSSWIEFYPNILPRKEVKLAHQLSNGQIKMMFVNKAEDIEIIRTKYGSSLSNRMSIEKAGKSVKVMMKVNEINPLKKNFDEVKEIIDSALDCLSQLVILYEKVGRI